MGKPSRDKGSRGERAVATEYRQQGIECARVPNSGGLDTKGDILGIPGVHCEVKSAGRVSVVEWMRQTEREAPEGLIPALHWRLCRRGGSTGWYVTVPLDDFVTLVKRSVL